MKSANDFIPYVTNAFREQQYSFFDPTLGVSRERDFHLAVLYPQPEGTPEFFANYFLWLHPSPEALKDKWSHLPATGGVFHTSGIEPGNLLGVRLHPVITRVEGDNHGYITLLYGIQRKTYLDKDVKTMAPDSPLDAILARKFLGEPLQTVIALSQSISSQGHPFSGELSLLVVSDDLEHVRIGLTEYNFGYPSLRDVACSILDQIGITEQNTLPDAVTKIAEWYTKQRAQPFLKPKRCRSVVSGRQSVYTD